MPHIYLHLDIIPRETHQFETGTLKSSSQLPYYTDKDNPKGRWAGTLYADFYYADFYQPRLLEAPISAILWIKFIYWIIFIAQSLENFIRVSLVEITPYPCIPGFVKLKKKNCSKGVEGVVVSPNTPFSFHHSFRCWKIYSWWPLLTLRSPDTAYLVQLA